MLYLLHDIFIHEAGRLGGAGPLISAFKPCLVWVVRPTYQIAQSVMPEDEGCTKIRKLLSLWVEKNILTSQEAEEVSILMTAKDLPSPQSGRLLQQVGVQMGMSVSQMQQGKSDLVGNILGALAPQGPSMGAAAPCAVAPCAAPSAAPCQCGLAGVAPQQLALAPRPPGLQAMPGPAG